MAKQTGSTSTVAIPLSKLIEKLGKYPELSVKVGKGWLAATSETFNVDFSVEAAVAETPAEERATVSVD